MPIVKLLIAAAAVILAMVTYFVVRNSKPAGAAISTAATLSPTITASPFLSPSASPAQAKTSATATVAATATAPASILPPVVQRVMASSELAPQIYQGERRHYEPRLAFDNDITTAWVPKNSGAGEWIEVRFQHPSMITSISVYGGYGADLQRFNNNNRVHELRLTFSNGFNRLLRLQNEPRFQRFDLPAHPTLEWIKFEIVSVYPGAKFDSTPISEIKFNEPE
jgi:hypothetical protein